MIQLKKSLVLFLLFFTFCGGSAENRQTGETTARLNFRREPTLESPIIRVLPKGRNLPLLEHVDEWYRTRYEKIDGWVNDGYIREIEYKEKDEDAVPGEGNWRRLANGALTLLLFLVIAVSVRRIAGAIADSASVPDVRSEPEPGIRPQYDFERAKNLGIVLLSVLAIGSLLALGVPALSALRSLPALFASNLKASAVVLAVFGFLIVLLVQVMLFVGFLWRRFPRARAVTAAAFAFVLFWSGLSFVSFAAHAYTQDFQQEQIQEIRSGRLSVFDRQGNILSQKRAEASGQFLPFEKIPEVLLEALLVQEDRDYFERLTSYDVSAISRAAVANVASGRIAQGGSTIEQQAARLLYRLPFARTWERKSKEYLLANALSSTYSKEEILEIYTTLAYLGRPQGRATYGFTDASQRYFGNDVSNLNQAEAAALVALLPSPNTISQDRTFWKAKRDFLLEEMARQGLLSHEELQSAKRTPLKTSAKRSRRADPHFHLVSSVLSRRNRTDVRRIDATVIAEWQKIAFEVFNRELAEIERRYGLRRGLLNGTLTVMDVRTGEVLAMTSRDSRFSQFNWATQSKRQIGSLAKPFVFAAVKEHVGFGPGTLIHLETEGPVEIDGWMVRNFNGRYPTQLTVADALAASNNVVPLVMARRIGLGAVRELFKRIGLPFRPYYPSILGATETRPIDLLAAYGALANGGRLCKPLFVRSFETWDNRETNIEPNCSEVMSKRVAETIYGLLGEVARRGTARKVTEIYGADADVGAKTGTTGDDALSVLVSRKIACLVMVGTNSGEPLERLLGRVASTGGRVAVPIGMKFLKKLEDRHPEVTGFWK